MKIDAPTDALRSRTAPRQSVEVMPTYVRLFADTAVKAEEVDDYT